MKRLFAIFVFLSLLLTACTVEKQAEEAMPGTEPSAEEPAPLTPEEPVAETPAEEAPKEEEKPAAEETPKPEEPAPAKEEPKDEQTFEVGIGDKVTYKGVSFTVENIQNVGNEIYLRFDADAYTLKLSSLRKSEILNSIDYELLDNTDYQKKQKVMLRLKPFKLGENEYLIEIRKSITVGGKLFTLGEVKYDSTVGESAYFNAGNYQYWVKAGETVRANGLSVSLLRAFYKQRQYAVMKIMPSA